MRWCIAGLAVVFGCRSSPVTIECDDLSYGEERAVRRIAAATVLEARRLLPALPTNVVLHVRKGSDVIPETGEAGTTTAPNAIWWTVDPTRLTLVVDTQLRATLFHELHHLVRDSAIPRRSLMDHVVAEGLATVFERDAAGARPPWAIYPDNVRDWVAELRALPANAPIDEWLYRHPDGRRWIGLRAGAYLVDRASKASGKSAAELATTPTAEVIALGMQ